MLGRALVRELVPPHADLAIWVLTRLTTALRPALDDPRGTLGLIGDVLVWDGPAGRRMVAGLEGLTDGQARIGRVVNHLEAGQAAASATLGTLVRCSMFNLGVTALGAGLMLARVEALHRRLGALAAQLDDVQAHQQAWERATLRTGLDFLGHFERDRRESDLQSALEHCTQATNVYRDLLAHETGGRRRVPLMEQCGRTYALALLGRARCLVLRGQPGRAAELLAEERPAREALAAAAFEAVLGRAPEAYLHPNFRGDGVTLGTLAEVYQQAHLAGAIGPERARDAARLFEDLRERIYAGRPWRTFAPRGRVKDRLLAGMRSLMGCLEEVNRVESLRLRLEDAHRGGYEPADLERELAAGPRPAGGDEGVNGPERAFAWAFA